MTTGTHELDPRVIELMQRRLDGACSNEENAEIDALLGSDPEARRVFGELGAVARMLDAMAEMPAPAGLRRDVMREIAVRPQSMRGSEGGRLAWLWPARVPALRYAVIVAAAVGLGVVVSQWASLSRIPVDDRQVSATLAPAVGQAESGIWNIAAGGATGTIRQVETPEGVGIVVDMTGDGALAVVIVFDPARARFVAVDGDVAAIGDGVEGRVSITPTPGTPFTVRIARVGETGSPVGVRLQRMEEILQEWTIVVGAG